MEILVSVAIAALMMLTGATVYVVRVVVTSRIDPPPTPAEPSHLEDHREAIADLNSRLDRLTGAVADGIERVTRSENRIQKTVTSARRLVRESGLEHAGIEAEYEELQPRNDEAVQPLPPLPQDLEETRTIRIPGGTYEIGVA